MMGIPTIIVEEHHEAYVAWHAAVQRHWLPEQGSRLLHVDSHADMSLPQLHTPLPAKAAPITDVDRFVMEELGIASFIMPAVLQGWFRSVDWLHPDSTFTTSCASAYLTLQQDDAAGRRFSCRLKRELSWVELYQPRSKTVRVARCALGTGTQSLRPFTSFAPPSALALDIDLDFFSCNRQPQTVGYRLEITKQQFDELTADRYHPLRILANGQFRPREVGGQYYLVSDVNAEGVSPDRCTETQILARIERLMACLNSVELKPRLITICRSRISGFTPADQWEFIEGRLLKTLEQHFCLDTQSLLELTSVPGPHQSLVAQRDATSEETQCNTHSN